MERLGDQVLRDLGAVGVSGVDQVHSRLDDPPQELAGPGQIVGLAPYPVAGDAHGPEAETAEVKIAAEPELAVGSCHGFTGLYGVCGPVDGLRVNVSPGG